MKITHLKYYLFLFFCSLTLQTQATHIVGGEITYTCIGNDQYEVTLTVFRDCINGNPNAYFDDPASIGIFDSNNNLVTDLGMDGQLLIPLMNDDTLNPVLTNPCLVIPPDVCVHTTTYRDTVRLPFRTGGYQLAYQRCCRNQTIVNIIEPLMSGATYSVTITEEALQLCNSSAKFQQWPPLYICVNEPIFFDQGAIDIDGDSIVYRMCAPLLGADPDIPLPQPPNPPPYLPVNWITPPFGVDNMLNGLPGGIPLEINPNTGLLTALPNTIGQFVVGICLEEYRNGNLISTTRRDFQYNVGVCGETVSSFFTPSVVCDDQLIVEFDNQSQNADQFEWHFNDPENPGFTSTAASPTYAYSEPGVYEIMLIAEPGNTCVDTFYSLVSVQYPTINADMNIEFGGCDDGLELLVTDATTDSVSFPVSWEWELLYNGGVIDTSTQQNPNFLLDASGSYEVKLAVTAENGCVSRFEETFQQELIDEVIETDSLQICFGNDIAINPIALLNYQYQWSPAETLDDPTSPNPRAIPTETTTYSLLLTDSVGFCTKNLEVTVVVPEPIILEMPPNDTTCIPEITLTPFIENGAQYFWSTDDEFNNIIGENPTLLAEPRGEETYYLLVRDEFGCPMIDSVTIVGNGVNLEVENLEKICEGDLTRLDAENVDPDDILSYRWTPNELFLSDTLEPDPLITFLEAGVYYAYLETENQYGCTRLDTVEIAVLDTMPTLDAVSFVQCSDRSVQFINNGINADYYVWDFGIAGTNEDISTETNPEFTYPAIGTYTVKLYYDNFLPCGDTLFLDVEVGEPSITLDVNSEITTCTDSATVQFQDLSTTTVGNIDTWNWTFSSGGNSMDQNPEIIVNNPGIYDATLVVTTSEGCEDTIVTPYIVPIVEDVIEDTLFLCYGDSIFGNPNFNPNFTYSWSPEENVSDPTSANPLLKPEVTTLYTINVQSNLSSICTGEETLLVEVSPEIEASFPSDETACGDDVTLMLETNDLVEIAWSNQANFSNILSDSASLTVNPGFLGNYFIRLRDSTGCEITEMVSVTNYEVDILAENRNICLDDTTDLAVLNLLPGVSLTYEWSPIESIIGDNTGSQIMVHPDMTTTYSVFVENEFGCTKIIPVTVNVFDQLNETTIIADPDSILLGKTITLEVVSAEAVAYQWEPNASLSDLTSAAPTVMPLSNETYTVTVTDENGCTGEASVSVIVTTPECDLPYVFFPNAFSPNGDGENDELQLYGTPIESAYWVIYNRWGEKVFETRDYQATWNGQYKNEDLPPDTYGYYLEVLCLGGERLVKKGNVTLIR